MNGTSEMVDRLDRRLAGRSVVVTGGAGGIGRAGCRAAASQGATVTVVDLAREPVEDMAAELAARGHQSIGLPLDVTSETDMARLAEATVERFGRIDVLVACAGVLRGRGCLPHPVVDVSTDEWSQVIDVNLTGIFLSNRAVLPVMLDQRQGDIVNVSSTAGLQGRANDAAYCASKFGVIGFSQSLAEEVRRPGIRVQTILPDAVDTRIWQQNGPIRPEHALSAERVADMILYLLSLPADTVMPSPVIAPFRTRRRPAAARLGESVAR